MVPERFSELPMNGDFQFPVENESPTEQLGRNSLSVYLLGLVDFDSAVQLQDRLIYEISGRDDTAGVLILCGHPPVISIGREGRRQDIGAAEVDLKSHELNLRWLSRGGGCFLHLPGQLAIQLLLPLTRLRIGLQEYRCRLERAVQSIAEEFNVTLDRRHESPGLWGRNAQAAYFGAAVKSGVSCQGIYLNVTVDVDLFRLVKIDAAGTGSRKTTSLETLRGGTLSMNRVREAAIRHICQEFHYDLHHVQTGHPLLRRTVRRSPTPV